MARVRDLPWKAIRRVGFRARKIFARTGRPEEEHLVVDAPIDVLKDELRKEHFRESWFLSYHYNGEDANLSRAEYKHGTWNDLQLHIRLFEREDERTDLHAHVELCPIQHPRKHLNGKMQSVSKGVQMSQGLMDKIGIGYERVKPDENE